MSSPIIDRVGGIVTSVAIKAPCRAVTTTNVALHGLQTIDDVPLDEGDRVLVAAQSDARQNGIYVASSGIWQRAYDFNSPRDHIRGTRVLVVEGETFGYREFWLSSRGLNIGVDPVEWEMVVTGPIGPQGPQGPQGPEGPEGPPGKDGASDWDEINNKPHFGTASEKDAGEFATADQGGKADTALQPESIGVTVQAHGDFLDALSGMVPGLSGQVIAFDANGDPVATDAATGDMNKASYDPGNIAGDVFDERNHGRASTMAQLITINPGKFPVVELRGFYRASDMQYPVQFYWDADRSKADHNGGSIVDPDHSEAPGSNGWYTAENSGTGCWVADMSEGVWETRLFGAKANTIIEEVDFDPALHNGGENTSYPYKIHQRVSGDDDSIALKALCDAIPDDSTLLFSPSRRWYYTTNPGNWGTNPYGSYFSWLRLTGKKNLRICGVSKESARIFAEQDITLYSLYVFLILGCKNITFQSLTFDYQATGYPDAATHPKGSEGVNPQTRAAIAAVSTDADSIGAAGTPSEDVWWFDCEFRCNHPAGAYPGAAYNGDRPYPGSSKLVGVEYYGQYAAPQGNVLGAPPPAGTAVIKGGGLIGCTFTETQARVIWGWMTDRLTLGNLKFLRGSGGLRPCIRMLHHNNNLKVYDIAAEGQSDWKGGAIHEPPVNIVDNGGRYLNRVEMDRIAVTCQSGQALGLSGIDGGWCRDFVGYSDPDWTPANNGWSLNTLIATTLASGADPSDPTKRYGIIRNFEFRNLRSPDRPIRMFNLQDCKLYDLEVENARNTNNVAAIALSGFGLIEVFSPKARTDYQHGFYAFSDDANYIATTIVRDGHVSAPSHTAYFYTPRIGALNIFKGCVSHLSSVGFRDQHAYTLLENCRSTFASGVSDGDALTAATTNQNARRQLLAGLSGQKVVLVDTPATTDVITTAVSGTTSRYERLSNGTVRIWFNGTFDSTSSAAQNYTLPASVAPDFIGIQVQPATNNQAVLAEWQKAKVVAFASGTTLTLRGDGTGTDSAIAFKALVEGVIA